MKTLRNMNRRNLCIAAAISLVAIVLIAETNQMKGDTMKTQQKAIVIALIGTLAVSSLTAVPAFAATSEPPSREAEVYGLRKKEPERQRCANGVAAPIAIRRNGATRTGSKTIAPSRTQSL